MQELQKSLSTEVRWVAPEGIHLTLKFLGNVDAGLVEDIFRAMQRASDKFAATSLELRLFELGVFPNRREPRVLWAGVEGDTEGLQQLQGLVDDSISELGFAKERRPFRPHLTLGRVRERVAPDRRRGIGEVISQSSLASCPPWIADELHLIRSTLTPQGAIYDSLGSVPFGNEA